MAAGARSLGVVMLALVGVTPDQPGRPGPGRAEVNSIGMTLVPIPAGEFVMGDPEPAEALAKAFPAYEAARVADLKDETPAHRVRITKAFEMGKFEVTVGRFRRFVADSGYRTDAERDGTGGHGYDATTGKFAGRDPKYTWRDPGFPQGDDHPVVNVS
jgi:sulfatase modifying factor 1